MARLFTPIFRRAGRAGVGGVEPAANVARVTVKGHPDPVVKFFGRQTARRLVQDEQNRFVTGQCLAHVPDINDFVGGMKSLKPQGVVRWVSPPESAPDG